MGGSTVVIILYTRDVNDMPNISTVPATHDGSEQCHGNLLLPMVYSQ